MALETLKDIECIGEFDVTRCCPLTLLKDEYDRYRSRYPIYINNEFNEISFKIQNGPIKENGVNGCQVDTLIETAMIILMQLNINFPCRENSVAITKLDEALLWLLKRKSDREKRGVEGHNKI